MPAEVKNGSVVIQTYEPDHYSIKAAAAQDYQAFYEEEILYRSLMDYPPVGGMLALHGQGRMKVTFRWRWNI